VVLCFAAIYIVHLIPVNLYRRLAFPLFGVSVVLLALTPLVGEEIHGAKRAIPLLGFTLHTADVARIGIILYLAKIIESEALSTYKEVVLKILLPVAIVFLLILLGSTSAALLFLTTVLLVLFVSEIRMAHLFKTIIMIIIAVSLYFADGATTRILPRSETALNRFSEYLGISSAADGDALHREDKQLDYSKMAIASGGLLGKGPGNSTQRHILPEAYSDFIYAIIIEEYGLVGGFVVFFLYLILLFRVVWLAMSCTQVFSMIAASGFVLAIVCQAILNMCVAVGLTPVTGQPLPLVSHGGSSLLTTSISLGIVLSISCSVRAQAVSSPQTSAEDKTLHADNST
jgi:cell division protein FtsW